jgi:hypothetical protein
VTTVISAKILAQEHRAHVLHVQIIDSIKRFANNEREWLIIQITVNLHDTLNTYLVTVMLNMIFSVVRRLDSPVYPLFIPLLTVCGFNEPLPNLEKSSSFMVTVQSALPASYIKQN